MVELCNGVKNCVEEYSCVEGSLHQQKSLPMLTTSCPLDIEYYLCLEERPCLEDLLDYSVLIITISYPKLYL